MTSRRTSAARSRAPKTRNEDRERHERPDDGRPRLPEGRRRSITLNIRISERELEMLHKVARDRDLGVSETIRWLFRREYDELTARGPSLRSGGWRRDDREEGREDEGEE
jgi:hypothetical protein